MLVLMYHAVHPGQEAWARQRPGGRWYAITAPQFEKQMEYLAQQGHSTPLIHEFLSGQAPAKSVVITFDDGHETNFSVAFPILQRFGFRAEFFVTVSRVDQPGCVTWDNLKRMQDAGMSVQSHGMHHQPLTELPPDALREELLGSKEQMERVLGTRVNYFSIPGGFADQRVYREAFACGYEAICNSETGIARAGKVLRRIAVMYSTSQLVFEGIVQRKARLLFQMSAHRALANTAKALLGVQRYEDLKRLRLRRLEK